MSNSKITTITPNLVVLRLSQMFAYASSETPFLIGILLTYFAVLIFALLRKYFSCIELYPFDLDNSIQMHKFTVLAKRILVHSLFGICLSQPLFAQHSVARLWNEELLEAIRIDLARPTVHARNLFHSSVAMYDAWSAYEVKSKPFLLGNSVQEFVCPFEGVPIPADIEKAREEAISYAMFRVLSHRFGKSPGASQSLVRFADLMVQLGYDTAQHSTEYQSGIPSSLGNYIAQCIINFGLQDGSNEINSYQNEFYSPINPPIDPTLPGNPDILDANRWQPITLDSFIDQSGNPIMGSAPSFLSPEWGNVVPFALSENDLKVFTRNGNSYKVYHDPGDPPYHGNGQQTNVDYKWGINMVSVWSSHLDPTDGAMWDISPGSVGNAPPLPSTFSDYPNFYKLTAGGDTGTGRALNPVTELPYVPNLVPRGDFTRVLAEFWADGPASETPPGHWFVILNYVNDHPLTVKKFKGEGSVLDDLEWDVKAYFVLGGAVHDAAISAWGIKGWYDYVRPLSGLRYLADLGQSSEPLLANYKPEGITLIPGYVEVIAAGDPLEGPMQEDVGKIKVLAWKGPDFIPNPEIDRAGVDWILAENWWPYQRPTFVTPPFAGFISGHSTFSRAAAEVLTLFTGDEFFPGGMGEFLAPQNDFLVFEEGPSVDVTLQWATYRDASDQTSLSRIWGGIHVPADDIPGRRIGEIVGVNAFSLAERYFDGLITSVSDEKDFPFRLYPNPAQNICWLEMTDSLFPFTIKLFDTQGRCTKTETFQKPDGERILVDLSSLQAGLYLVQISSKSRVYAERLQVR